MEQVSPGAIGVAPGGGYLTSKPSRGYNVESLRRSSVHSPPLNMSHRLGSAHGKITASNLDLAVGSVSRRHRLSKFDISRIDSRHQELNLPPIPYVDRQSTIAAPRTLPHFTLYNV